MLRRLIPLALALSLMAAACASDDAVDEPRPTLTTTSTTMSVPATTTTVPETTTSTTFDDGFPVTIEAANGAVTIEQPPVGIVSLSPSTTEILYAVGAGSQVIAVDEQSNYPSEAPMTDLTGLAPNVEAIAELGADLVFLSFDPGDVVAGLEAVGITAIVHPAVVDLDGAYTQWEQVGAATGHIAEAAALVAEVESSITAARADLPPAAGDLSYYYELDPTLYSVTSSTFVGSLFALTGMGNIADEADPDGYGYPQLTAEYVLDADPSMIFLADTKCCGQTAEDVAARPGWETLSAVRAGGVVELDDDVASRWGPRVADLFETVVAAVAQLEVVNA